jgi:hypothetical protein
MCKSLLFNNGCSAISVCDFTSPGFNTTSQDKATADWYPIMLPTKEVREEDGVSGEDTSPGAGSFNSSLKGMGGKFLIGVR